MVLWKLQSVLAKLLKVRILFSYAGQQNRVILLERQIFRNYPELEVKWGTNFSIHKKIIKRMHIEGYITLQGPGFHIFLGTMSNLGLITTNLVFSLEPKEKKKKK